MLNSKVFFVASLAISGGCFAENPNDTRVSASGTEATTDSDVTTDVSGSTDTSEPTTEGPTTEPTTTTEATTTEATTTTEPTSTTEMCPSSDCLPGEVQVGEECGNCGNQQRTCTDDCEWGDFECVDGPELCEMWIWGEMKVWQGSRITPSGSDFHSPKEDIRAAFDVQALGRGYVLTDTSYHILDIGKLEWVDSGPREELFPELDGKELYAAYNVHDQMDPPMLDTVTVTTPGNVHLYQYNLSEQTIIYVETQLCCDQWEPPALSPLESDVDAFWLSLDPYPWELLPETSVCGDQEPNALPRHGAAIAAGKVHIQDVGSCFEWVEKHNFSEFPPFSQAGAPPSAELVGAAFWNQGLYVFREDL